MTNTTTTTTVTLGATSTGAKIHVVYNGRPWCAADNTRTGWNGNGRNKIVNVEEVAITDLAAYAENANTCRKCAVHLTARAI